MNTTHTTRVGLAAWLLLIAAVSGRLRVPARAAKPVFEGWQGKQRTEIHFDPASGTVTGYASEVLQYRFDLNQVKPNWVMMFPQDKTNELPGRGAEEQHDPEKG